MIVTKVATINWVLMVAKEFTTNHLTCYFTQQTTCSNITNKRV